jgi:glycosyltransferase involved in cell wall biosynthesis
MRVLVNAVPIYGKGAGARTYTAGLLTALSATDADMEWHVLVRDADFARLGLTADSRFKRLRFIGPAAPPAIAGARFFWRNTLDQIVIPSYGRRFNTVHYLDSYGPLMSWRGTTPFALTVHDLFPITHPDYFSPWVARYLASLMRVIPRAASIMAISAETARELTRILGIAPERVKTVHNGVDARFHPASQAQRSAVAARYVLDGPYLIAVGAVEARKNLARVMRAFAAARAAARFPHRLLVVGKPGWGYQEIAEEAHRVGDGAVRLLGYIPAEDLPPLISGADALIHLSLAEGFGLPVIEGMACGTPVITSSVGALAEVANSAALLVDPTDERAISSAIAQVCMDAALRARLQVSSLDRARHFTWARVAEAAIEAYREAASRGVNGLTLHTG